MNAAVQQSRRTSAPSRLARNLILGGLLFLSVCPSAWAAPDTDTLRDWIMQMKVDRRGPFSRVLWFCADGAKLAPRPYACVPHGGGKQHGELNEHAQTLRANGYFVANVLAELDPQAFVQLQDASDRFKQILIEQFLIRTDDGWILRKARYYRGALQEEDERRAARRLLMTLLLQPDWLNRDFLVLRAGARLLAHGEDGTTITELRERAADLSERDPGFADLKSKIHVQPDATDIERVRRYAKQLNAPELVRDYASLADLMAQVYSPRTLSSQLQTLVKQSSGHPLLRRVVRDGMAQLEAAQAVEQRLTLTAGLMAKLRDMLGGPYEPGLRLAMLDTSLALEAAHFTAATELGKQLPAASRQMRIHWLGAGIQAAYGAGLLSKRQYRALDASLSRIDAHTVKLATYKTELDYLALVPAWADRQLEFHFQEPVQRLTAIEPMAALFVHDILRGGPLLFYSSVLDGLLRDANRLAGVHKILFGKEVGSGVRALNPGVARGTPLMEIALYFVCRPQAY